MNLNLLLQQQTGLRASKEGAGQLRWSYFVLVENLFASIQVSEQNTNPFPGFLI
jgi:hypothetical protein